MEDRKRPTRFAIWVWGRSIDDFARFCLPSILQPGNLPWLVRNGYPIVLDFYKITTSTDNVERLAQSIVETLHGMTTDADVTATVHAADAAKAVSEIKIEFFKLLVKRGIESRAPGLFVFADMYFGDGSIRNIVTYGQKPGVTIGGLYLRVKRDLFSDLLDLHFHVTQTRSISNGRLVDIAFDSLIDGMRSSFADDDNNATFATSGSIRKITDELYTYTFHSPTPILFVFEEQDAVFFERFNWNVYFLDHIWPSLLIAQNRWRVMASSDMFFLAELNGGALEAALHTHLMLNGMQYNDEYIHEQLNGRVHQTMLMTMRRERLPRPAR